MSARPAVVFDVAQVLLGWDPAALLRAVVPRLARDAPTTAALELQVFEQWGGDWADFDRGLLDDAAITERIVRRTGLPGPEVAAIVQAIPDALQPIDGTVRLVEGLAAAGHPVYFLSNMPASYARRLRARHPVFAVFDDGVFSAEVRLVKPEPAIYGLAAARFGHEPAGLVFIDDSAANVAAARAQGWHGVLFHDPAQTAGALRGLGVTVD